MAHRPRVLLVEDDSTLRRMLAMVLEAWDIELIGCASVAEARVALRQAPVSLVITDLMLPAESGHVLLAELQAQPALRAGARLVVFSAGLDDEARARLAKLDGVRFLSKPSGVQAIEDCVREALWGPSAEAVAAGSLMTVNASRIDAQASNLLSLAEQSAVLTYFGGSTGLYLGYRAACVAQFALDLEAGEQALQQRDGPAMRRLAHNLKSVLRMLGDEAGSQLAAALEAQAEPGQIDQQVNIWPWVAAAWAALRERVRV